ncbi:exophilin-5 isoform X1 [Coturnix japonica]|nr:exophilin-5 isoform X1 [Coturnix japonica]
MLKPPLEHQIRNSKKSNHKEFKMSSSANPQAQKNTSTSFLGFRSPFAWLFSFRKSRKNQTQKQPRYDDSANTAPKVEEMAMAEMCNAPMLADTSGHSFDVKQDQVVEESNQEWNEQLEKEFFSVLSDLDDQLAQEQSQDPLDRTVSSSSASNVQYNQDAFPTLKRNTANRGQLRNDWNDIPSTFFPDGLRTIRAKDEHKIVIRPRKLHSAYINWQQTAFQDDFKYSDPADGNSHLRSSRQPSFSFGRSSEGSLYPPSITQNSGFRHKSYMDRRTAGRSYSVCSLRRCPSSVSSDQLSASSLQYPFARENSNGFVPRFGRQNPKRIPLSSIVWNNTPDSPGQRSTQEKMFRTQSLMEFHATDHGRYPSSLQENEKYTCYHSKHHYRRSISSSNCFSRISCPDKATSPSSFDNWENYPFYQSESNLSRSYCRDISSHGKLYANHKNSPYGKTESYLSWTDIPQYYNDNVFISPDTSFEVMMANLNDQQLAYTRNAKFASQHLQNDFHMYSPENMNIKTLTRSASRAFSEFAEGHQPWLSCNSVVSSSIVRSDESVSPNLKDQTKPVGLNRNTVVTQRGTKAGVTPLEKAECRKLPDEVDATDIPLQSVSQQADANYINTQSFSLFNTLRSKRQTQVSARTDTAKMNALSSNTRNVQMKETSCAPSSVFSQSPCTLPANKSKKESFLPSQKEWEHNLHYVRRGESAKQDNQSAEAVNQAAPEGQSAQLNAASAPSPEQRAICHGLSWPPDRSSGSSQSSPPALYHGVGKTAQVSRRGVTKKTSQKTPQNTSTLVTKNCSELFNASSPQQGNSGNTSTCSFDGDPKSPEHNLNYFCLEKENGKIGNHSPCTERLHKQDGLLRHTSSCSITGSPRRSSLKSSDPLVIYYTLPRKSASIAGSIMSDTPISFPRENRSMYDCLRSETPSGAYPSCQRDVSCLDSKHSFLRSAPLSVATSNKQKYYSNPLTRSPNDSSSSSASAELTDRCEQLSKRESSVFSDCKERGNCLQKYKTTSTFTVCVDEDHVKYHELVSIYYTLPRRHSKTFCNLFRDNAEDADLSLPSENSQSPRIRKKKSEGHVSLTNVFFPSTLEKEVPSCSSDQAPSAPVTPQNVESVAHCEEENSHLSPGSEKACTSKTVSTVNSRNDSSTDLPSADHVLSDMAAKDICLGGPQSIAVVANSDNGLSDVSNNQNTETCPKEKKKIAQTASPLTSTLPTPPKPGRPLENSFYSASTSKNSIQKRNSANCSQPAAVSANKNQNSSLLRTREKASRGRIHTECANVSLPPREDKGRGSTKVKQGVNFPPQTTPLCNNKSSRLQLRAGSSRNNANNVSSYSKMLSETHKKEFEVSTASSSDALLQPDEEVSADTGELKNSEVKKEQNLQSTQTDKGCSGLQALGKHSEGSLDINSRDKVFRVTQDQKLTQNVENENKLLSNCTRDKIKDIEKRKNRPSIKNKLAAVCKTSRKFSSKNLPPKPHISNIFSQNDGNATCLEVSVSPESLSSAGCHQSLLQSEAKNQNDSLDSAKNSQTPKTAEVSKNENVNDLSLPVNNLNWRSLKSSYTQKEATSSKKHAANMENSPGLTTLSPDKALATRNKNSQTPSLRLENTSQSISPSTTALDTTDDKRASSSACTPPLPLLTDKNSNTFISNCLQADICSKQNLTSQAVLTERQKTSGSSSLRNANLHSQLLHKARAKNQHERHFSESICAQDSHETFASGSNILPKDGVHGKRCKFYSEVLSCDENENWALDEERCYSTRNLMYPSVEFGIFGKEQQLAFLENIKRSLTEGRLWRPCLLNNPSAFRDGETPSISRTKLFSSSSAGSKVSSAASSPQELPDIYQDDPAAYTDSDSDTTTDDEYYLDEIDKESEL